MAYVRSTARQRHRDPNPRGSKCWQVMGDFGLYHVIEIEASLGYAVGLCSPHSSWSPGQCLFDIQRCGFFIPLVGFV